jgi:hypothetical protein
MNSSISSKNSAAGSLSNHQQSANLKSPLKSNNQRPNQLEYSISEINSNKFILKSALIHYSTNVKHYAKWFDVANIIKNEDTYTVYQVIYRVKLDMNENYL